MAETRIAQITILNRSPAGQIINKETASINDILNSSATQVILPDATNGNTSGYPTVKSYLEREASDGYSLFKLFANMVITHQEDQTISYTPNQIADLALWWIADGSFVISGSTATWTDYANSKIASSSSGSMPTFISSTDPLDINGQSVLSFAQDFLQIGVSGPYLYAKPGFTLVSVYRYRNTSDNSGAVIDIVNRATLGHYTSGSDRKARLSYRRLTTDTVSTIDGPAYVNETVYLGIGLVDYTSGSEKAFLEVNGTRYNAASTPSSGNTSATNTTLGIGFKDRSVTSNFDGEIAEIIVYNRALTDEELTGLKNYLGKYGV